MSIKYDFKRVSKKKQILLFSQSFTDFSLFYNLIHNSNYGEIYQNTFITASYIL